MSQALVKSTNNHANCSTAQHGGKTARELWFCLSQINVASAISQSDYSPLSARSVRRRKWRRSRRRRERERERERGGSERVVVVGETRDLSAPIYSLMSSLGREDAECAAVAAQMKCSSTISNVDRPVSARRSRNRRLGLFVLVCNNGP